METGPPPAPKSEPRPLRIVFMGTPELAAHILRRLLQTRQAAWQVVAVVTRPDQPRGRGLKLEPSEVGAVAAAHQLPTLKPSRIRGDDFRAELSAYQPDLLVVAAYGRILPQTLLELPRRLPINVHASLLPRHRGASPIQGAVLAGDPTSGVTIMRVVERMDAGPILLERETPLAADETADSLQGKLAELGAQALIEVLEMLVAGDVPEIPQDEERATYTPLIKKADARIGWDLPAERIERMVRAYRPWPVAHAILDGEELRIYRAAVEPGLAGPDTPPGAIVALDPAPLIQCGAGRLRLLEVQAPGRKRMSAAAFARGRHLSTGMRLQ